MSSFLAHVRRNEQGEWEEHALLDHLLAVGSLAESFATRMAAGKLGLAAGIWHDLGKYSVAFQERIRIRSGYEAAEAHLEGKTARQVDHSTAGGIFAQELCGAQLGLLLAFPILGHHTGLQDYQTIISRLDQGKSKHGYLEQVRAQIPPELRLQPSVKQLPFEYRALFIRMLFSCLVDADRLDTEAFMSPERTALRDGYRFDLTQLAQRLDAYLASKMNSAEGPVNELRASILTHATAQATESQGFFTLTVPTGGGKTLTSLAFALQHAITHRLERVVYVIPYTSIIDQTARVFREALGAENVLEHHANLDPQSPQAENPVARLMSENWAAPVVVTTSVQFFESLFSRKTSRCRRLHNIANAVVVLDEAQLLPPDYLQPILKTLRELVAAYRTTVVLCTATQPALETVREEGFDFIGIDGARELAPDPPALYEKLRRVRVHVPTFESPADPTTDRWESIAARVRAHSSALVIVNRRRDARKLAELIGPATLHLSTWMCGRHRMDTLNSIRELLAAGKAACVVSTQLVEAGVDVDFPVVYRAMAGLDSIAQAAGRCNREGRLEMGDVFVFLPPERSPPGHLRQMEQAAFPILKRGGDVLALENFREYFRELFWSRGSSLSGPSGLDRKAIVDSEAALLFEKVHDDFRIIETDDVPVIVPYGASGMNTVRRLQNLSDDPGKRRAALRRAQPFAVNVRRRDVNKMREAGAVRTIDDTVTVLVDSNLYSSRWGLTVTNRERAA